MGTPLGTLGDARIRPMKRDGYPLVALMFRHEGTEETVEMEIYLPPTHARDLAAALLNAASEAEAL